MDGPENNFKVINTAMIDDPRKPESGGGVDKKDMRKAMEISSYVGDLGMKILPGKEWGVHFKNPAKREEILQAVLQGRMSPHEVDITELTPIGISYRLKDIETLGLNAMVGKVRDQANYFKHFDHRGFLDFLAGLSGRNVDLETATSLFASIGRTRVQSELLRAMGPTGRTQLKGSLRRDAEALMNSEDLGQIQSLLELLKLRWLAKQGVIGASDLKKFEQKTSEEIVELADELDDAYLDYVQKGDVDSRRKLIDRIRGSFSEIQKQVEADKLDDFIDDQMEKYEDLPPPEQQEIDNAFNDYEPPQNDIPPSHDDSFSPSMDEMKEVGEKQKVTPLYTVEPPLTGLYQGPIYSNFNASQVKWEMAHSTQKVHSATAPSQHIMRGKIAAGSTIPIYLPRNFDVASIPSGLELMMDENHTYFLRNNSSSARDYELGFGKQSFTNTKAPSAGEKADISSGGLSIATSNYLNSLRGKNNVEKAQAIIHYMKNIIGLKYSNDSKFNRIYKQNPSRYFYEIEKNKEVDCDVAQTYFIALCRKAGVPSRLVTGHSVDLVQDNKAILHRGTGHAWSEIWDEQNGCWKTIDATPEKDSDDEEGGGGQTKPKTENTDLDAPEKEQDSSPSPEKVKNKVDQQVEDAQKGDQDGKEGDSPSSTMPDSAKEKMKQKKEKQPQAKPGEPGEAGDQQGDPSEIDEQEWKEMEKEMQEMEKKHEEMTKKAAEIQKKMDEAKSLKELKDLEKELNESDIYDETKEKMEEKLEAKEEQAKEELIKEIEKMRDDGFITEEQAEKMLKELEKDKMEDFLKIEKQLEHESALYNEYEDIREEIMPLVDEWFEFFADRLPKIEEIDFDEDARTMKGRFDRRSISRPRNLLFGQTQNPQVIERSTEPRYMASIVVDISGSMSHRMRDARKLLIFFSELFEKISKEFGYIKFSISAFDTEVELIKDFDHEYDSPTRYDFGNGEKTVKVRLMEATMARGGTDMGKAVWDANKRLNEAKSDHPDYLSSLYTISDGETGGELSGDALTKFLDGQQSFWGEWWGDHMKCGFLLGDPSQKAILGKYFGEDNAEAVPNLNELIEKVMNRFDEDVQGFIDDLPER